MPDSDKSLREHLLVLLSGRGAHAPFEDAVKDFPTDLQGKKPTHSPHTAWQLLEHLRIAQWDILDFCINPHYQEMQWPAAYWPQTSAPPDATAWDKSVGAFQADLKKMQQLVQSPETNFYVKIPWGSGQTILREVLLVADHNAYHIGQLVLVRRLLDTWK